VSAEIKFCGLTRPEDAAFAATLGASYIGVIFAGGPRALNIPRAMEVLGAAPRTVARVGVFADQSAEEIAGIASVLQLDALQLHGSFDPPRLEALRKLFDGEIWPVCRVSGATLPPVVHEMLELGDGLLLDAAVPGKLGGTGVTLPWTEGKWMTGTEYLVQFALPNFYFHLTTAYAILRHNGVPLGKADFIVDLPFLP